MYGDNGRSTVVADWDACLRMVHENPKKFLASLEMYIKDAQKSNKYIFLDNINFLVEIATKNLLCKCEQQKDIKMSKCRIGGIVRDIIKHQYGVVIKTSIQEDYIYDTRSIKLTIFLQNKNIVTYSTLYELEYLEFYDQTITNKECHKLMAMKDSHDIYSFLYNKIP